MAAYAALMFSRYKGRQQRPIPFPGLETNEGHGRRFLQELR